MITKPPYRMPALALALSLQACATPAPVLQPIRVQCPKPQITPELLQEPPHLAWDKLMSYLATPLPNAPPPAPVTQP